MLLHSREGSGERTSVNVNAMVEEALNLAYHGARAEKPGFNVTIAKSLDPNAGAADLYAQEMTRVLLNLISNGFYATTKRKQGEANGAYEPTHHRLDARSRRRVEIAIRDNGTGIPDEVKAKMFNPFFTTKPAGEGTGLGLSLSHDIVVKQHGGTLEVSTEPGVVHAVHHRPAARGQPGHERADPGRRRRARRRRTLPPAIPQGIARVALRDGIRAVRAGGARARRGGGERRASFSSSPTSTCPA